MTMVLQWHWHTVIISATVDGSVNMEMKLMVSTSLMARMRMHLRLLTNAEVMDLKARTVSRIPHSEQSVLDTVNHIFFWIVIHVQRAHGLDMVDGSVGSIDTVFSICYMEGWKVLCP